MAAVARTTTDQVRGVLMGYVSSITADSVLKAALRRAGRSTTDIDRDGVDEPIVAELGRGLAFFLSSDRDRQESIAKLSAVMQQPVVGRGATSASVEITDESCIVDARTQARALARDLGFCKVDQAKIATCVSELARNVYAYAKRGRLDLVPVSAPRSGLRVVSTDSGPGIPNVQEILSGAYQSKTGMGLGILGCKRLMDEFELQTKPGLGTVITLVKYVT